MSDESDEVDEIDRLFEEAIEQYQAMIEKRVREQVARHHHVDPTIDRKRIVEIQIRQERERLERMADRTRRKRQRRCRRCCPRVGR